MPERLVFVTSNPNKAMEAERILRVPLDHVSLSFPEIQASGVEQITRHKLETAREGGYPRLIVEDVSLGFRQLGNFPGPYIHWLLASAGGEGLGTVASALDDRSALAQCCVAYWDADAGPLVFLGEVEGEILTEPRGVGFGWDPWFIPTGQSQSFAEMGSAEKDRLSHRGLAYKQLATFLSRRMPPVSDSPSISEDSSRA